MGRPRPWLGRGGPRFLEGVKRAGQEGAAALGLLENSSSWGWGLLGGWTDLSDGGRNREARSYSL